MFKGLTKEEKSWIFYDWANSAYTMVVTSTIMSIYFLEVATREFQGVSAAPEVAANSFWGYANSISTILLLIL